MSIEFKGTTYLIGPVRQTCTGREWDDAGRVDYGGNSCPVLRHSESGDLVLVQQPLNSQWPAYRPLRTQAELLEGWA
jgi:hypothetical protein